MALIGAKRAKRAASEAEESTDENLSDASDNEGNSGWADCMQKVLQGSKPKNQSTAVLARAKKLKPENAQSKKPKKPTFDFEIEGAEVKEEEQDEADVKPEASALDAQLTRQQRKNVPLQLRVKPSFRDLERERSLRKVATRGTVQFFNAVRIQQKDLQQQLDDAGPLDSRKDAVLNNIDKRKFLDVLMSGKRAKSAAIDKPVKKEESESEDDEHSDDDELPAKSVNKKKSEWNVLREDFMTNKKIKHWDEEDDHEEGSDAANEDSNNDSDDE